MEKRPLTGSRIRSYRVDRGLRQAQLAEACDISASYLNLIEHNRRRIGGALLVRIAKALDVDPAYLSGIAEVRVAADMDAAAEIHAEASPERARAEELAARFPGWARLIARQHRENRRLEQVIERLDDRLTHDPFLSASMHNVLTSVTAIRSASAILTQGGEIEPEWQARFHRNIFEDSQRLTEATEALVRYLDSDESADPGGSLPQDDVDRWLATIDWHVEALEGKERPSVEELLQDENVPRSPPAQILARRYLERYASDAAVLPYDQLASAVQNGATAPELARMVGVGLPVVFRRFAALRAKDTQSGEVFGLVACDASGTLTYRKPIDGFELPRYSAACPFWPLFAALQRPMALISDEVSMAGRDEARFEVQAFAEVSYPAGFEGPALSEAWMLFQSRLGSDRPAKRIGTSCRICPEVNCVARREPSVFGDR